MPTLGTSPTKHPKLDDVAYYLFRMNRQSRTGMQSRPFADSASHNPLAPTSPAATRRR